MEGGYDKHVCGAVAENVREGFGFFTVAAGWAGIGPAILHGIGGQAIKASSVDKAPVLEAYIEASVVPGRAVGEAISSKGASGFALVAKVGEFGSSSVTCEVMQKAAGILCEDGFVVCWCSNGSRAFIRDRDRDWESFCGSLGLRPKGGCS